MRAIAVIPAIAVLALAGCMPSLPSIPDLPGLPDSGAVEELVESATGGHGVPQASLPADWPDELPLPDQGRLFEAVTVDGGQSLMYLIDDTAVGERLVDALIGSGYRETARADYGQLISVVLEGDRNITVGWVEQEDGAILTYFVSSPS